MPTFKERLMVYGGSSMFCIGVWLVVIRYLIG